MKAKYTQLPYREELRRKFPGLARRAEAGSALAAIKLHCLECEEGTYAAIEACVDKGCSLYPYRLGHKPKRKTSKDTNKKGGFTLKFQRKREEPADALQEGEGGES